MATDAEQRFWRALRDRQLLGLKFRRQVAFGPYVLDLYCPAQRLVIELDGSQHLTCAGKAEDAVRTAYLEQRGVRVLRFTNLEVLQETTAVLEAVQRAVSTSRQS